MGNHEINQILIDYLQTMSGFPTLIEENMKPQTVSGMFIQAHLLPVSATEIDFCGSEEKRGMIQFSVIDSRDNGTRQAMQLSDRIAQHFKTFQHLNLKMKCGDF